MSRWSGWADEPPIFTRKAEAEIMERHKNRDEAMTLIALIAAEFESDPMSVQCFDLRVVARVIECAAKHRRLGNFL